MGNKISYIQVCKVCEHYDPLDTNRRGYCSVLGGYQVINVANSCPYFKGEKYKFNYDKAMAMGERPSTFSKND